MRGTFKLHTNMEKAHQETADSPRSLGVAAEGNPVTSGRRKLQIGLLMTALCVRPITRSLLCPFTKSKFTEISSIRCPFSSRLSISLS